MRELLELRVHRDHYRELFVPDEGELNEAVFIVFLDAADPRLNRVEELQRYHNSRGESFFYFSDYHRKYSDDELDAAELFRLAITRAFEPTGEECGTEYDETTACVHCGVGRSLRSTLRLDLSRIPHSAALARSIADERVVSQQLASLMSEAGLTGWLGLPVTHRRSGFEWESRNLQKYRAGRELLQQAKMAGAAYGTNAFWGWVGKPERQALLDTLQNELSQPRSRTTAAPPSWLQLVPVSLPVEVSAQTRFGNGPFDPDEEGQYKCPLGHVAGLNVLSELHINRRSWDGSDFAVTDVSVGARRGLLRPAPLMLVTQRFRRLLLQHKLKGYSLEIARVE